MATYQIAPPEKFISSQPDEWPKWIRRFEQFRVASGLKAKSEKTQVNTLVYSMGTEADDILYSFDLMDAQKKEYATVVSSFEGYFVKKRNVIYERAKFNQRKQHEGESVDIFITALHNLAEHCRYGELREEMICDRIVVGLLDTALSEKLQLDPDLTLEKAMTSACQREMVRKQQPVLRHHEQPIELTWLNQIRRTGIDTASNNLITTTDSRPQCSKYLVIGVGKDTVMGETTVQQEQQFVTSAKSGDTFKLFVSPSPKLWEILKKRLCLWEPLVELSQLLTLPMTCGW